MLFDTWLASRLMQHQLHSATSLTHAYGTNCSITVMIWAIHGPLHPKVWMSRRLCGVHPVIRLGCWTAIRQRRHVVRHLNTTATAPICLLLWSVQYVYKPFWICTSFAPCWPSLKPFNPASPSSRVANTHSAPFIKEEVRSALATRDYSSFPCVVLQLQLMQVYIYVYIAKMSCDGQFTYAICVKLLVSYQATKLGKLFVTIQTLPIRRCCW